MSEKEKKFGDVAFEDCIMQKGTPTTAGSEILDGFNAPFDAAVIEKLNEAKIPLTGTVSMSEFGLAKSDTIEDLTSVSGVNKAVRAVASGQTEYALCNDVFGKICCLAPFNGLACIRPTYGTVSRYGLIPSVSSMEQIGIVCKNPSDGYRLLSVIAGNDSRDGAMFPETSYAYKPCNENIKIAIPDNVWGGNEDDGKIVPMLESKFSASRIELKYFDCYSQVLHILGYAELCNNTNRYDGVKFGHRTEKSGGINDMYINTRSEAFTLETKLAIITGAMVLSQDYYEKYYEKAMKIRRLIKDSLDFGAYDVIALPIRSGGTPYEQSAWYALPALAGLPSLSVPLGHNLGVLLIADVKNENALWGAWEVLSREI